MCFGGLIGGGSNPSSCDAPPPSKYDVQSRAKSSCESGSCPIDSKGDSSESQSSSSFNPMKYGAMRINPAVYDIQRNGSPKGINGIENLPSPDPNEDPMKKIVPLNKRRIQ